MLSILKEQIQYGFNEKPVKFNTRFGQLDDKTRSFAIHTPDEYITIRVNEHEKFVEVIKIDINNTLEKGE